MRTQTHEATMLPSGDYTRLQIERHFRAGILFLAASCLLPGASVRADGGFVWGQFEDIHAPEQKAAIAWDGRRETMVLSTRVRAAEVADFGWIIPVESRTPPQVELADPTLFAYLKEYFVPIPQGIGGVGESQQSVEIMETKNLDIYKVTVVKATDAQAFLPWLQKNGFRADPAVESVLGSYRLENFFFVLARIDLTLKYAPDLDFVLHQPFLADVKSLDGKAIKALAALRWPARDKSLAELVAEDIRAGRPYPQSALASNPLNAASSLVTPTEYRRLAARRSRRANDPHSDLVQELSDRFLANENVQHFVRVENILRDLDTGVANPLRISFEPSQPFFPMRISSINKGKVAVALYLFANEPLKESGGTLRADVWKPVTDDLRQKARSALDITACSYLTKLTFFGDSTAFVQDARFEPMTAAEKRSTAEEYFLVAPLVAEALTVKDANALADALKEHPRAHEFLDPCLPLALVRAQAWYSRTQEPPEESVRTLTALLGVLIDHGFDINFRDENGRTALHDVAGAGWRYWIPMGDANEPLPRPGNQAEVTDTAPVPPATLATELAAFLLQKGAQVNAKDAAGKTPLDLVFDRAERYADHSLHAMAILLIRHGGTLADLDRKDLGFIRGHFTEAILPVARAAGNKEVVGLLTRGSTDNASDIEKPGDTTSSSAPK